MKNSRSRSRSPIRSRSMERRVRDRDNRSNSPFRGGGGGGGHRGGGGVSDRMVYLSNLPFESTWMELKDMIREKVGEVNFVEVLQDRVGKSKGCAVVDFKSRDEALKCVEKLHRVEVAGRLIVAKEIRDPVAFFRKVKEDTGIDFLGRGDSGFGGGGARGGRGGGGRGGGGRGDDDAPPIINENETYGLSPAFLSKLNIGTPLEKRVFITNVSYNCGVGRLYDIFAIAGKIVWIDLQLDKDGKTKGISVVEYSHPIEAVQAISMLHNQRIFDRTISVKMDKFPREGENRRDGELPFGLHSVGMGLGANGAPLTDVASVISTLAPAPGPFQNGSSLTMAQAAWGGGGAPAPMAVASYAPAPVQQTYASYADGLAPQGVGIQTGGGAGGGYGGGYQQQQVQPQQQVPAPVPAPTLAQQTGTYYGGGGGGGVQQQPQMRQSPAQQQQGGWKQQPTPGTPQMMGGGGGSYGGVGGGAVGSSVPYTSRVLLIKNLPLDYTWQIVSDRVQQFGDLESVEMVSQGVAKIRFMQMKDAERAKNTLHGTTVEGRGIGTEYL